MAEQRINSDLALEMTMQEVLGNIEELALDFGFSNGEDCFEIIAIEAADEPHSVSDFSSDNRIRSPLLTRTAISLQQKQRNVA